jgi:hypothetical protein
MTYAVGQRALQNARQVHVFNAQSLYITKQGFTLVLLLNKSVDEDGPSDEERAERSKLQRYV